MEESTTYQEIIEKGMERGLARGQLAEARAILLRRGSSLGSPSPQCEAPLNGITDIKRLDDLLDRLLDDAHKTWDDLLT